MRKVIFIMLLAFLLIQASSLIAQECCCTASDHSCHVCVTCSGGGCIASCMDGGSCHTYCFQGPDGMISKLNSNLNLDVKNISLYNLVSYIVTQTGLEITIPDDYKLHNISMECKSTKVYQILEKIENAAPGLPKLQVKDVNSDLLNLSVDIDAPLSICVKNVDGKTLAGYLTILTKKKISFSGKIEEKLSFESKNVSIRQVIDTLSLNPESQMLIEG